MIVTGSVSVADIARALESQVAANKDVIDSLLKEVAQVVRDDAKQTAAFIDKTGNLRKSIGMRRSKFIDGGYIVKASGRNRDTDSEGGKGFHAWLVEFGHVKVLWGRRTGGRVAPRPFMRPALEKGISHAATKISSITGAR